MTLVGLLSVGDCGLVMVHCRNLNRWTSCGSQTPTEPQTCARPQSFPFVPGTNIKQRLNPCACQLPKGPRIKRLRFGAMTKNGKRGKKVKRSIRFGPIGASETWPYVSWLRALRPADLRLSGRDSLSRKVTRSRPANWGGKRGRLWVQRGDQKKEADGCAASTFYSQPARSQHRLNACKVW